MGGPFSTNLRRLYRSRSDGGAGADHAEEMLAQEGPAPAQSSALWFAVCFFIGHRWTYADEAETCCTRCGQMIV